ncbi:hypothetical protein EJ06DRAFT_535365 [Trichodelitschia bisporula]|uniref:Uncharacterized protein n=1 Tax=Trichodelitschia bisporula TaxID=703511 RepID=A0A6G1IB21_9PEZI|nr:hypothetical protein EJ06DRAFT_535365 [Trichodelitschia bisporula]
MTSSLRPNRKRSATSELPRGVDIPAVGEYMLRDTLKRNKIVDELENVNLASKEDSWNFDVGELLRPTPFMLPGNDTRTDANNLPSFDASDSLVVLCVLEQLDIHIDLLCQSLPTLASISPNIQVLILTRSIQTVLPLLESLPYSFPVVEARGPPSSHFLRLGLLHPLGGGQHALDAIVLLDNKGRRRLVLPFGWGAGRHARDLISGKIIQHRFREVLEDSVRILESEK